VILFDRALGPALLKIDMLFSIRSVASTLLLAGVVSAQTPPGFVPEVTEKLEIIFGDKVVQTAGESLTRAGRSFSNLHDQLISSR
jgi:hypothetical protein